MTETPDTLPQLPKLHQNRAVSHIGPSSPPHSHQRSSSGLYYAAAWGSPYATPSPRRSTEHGRSSPESAVSNLFSAYCQLGRGNWMSDDSTESQRTRKSASNRQRAGESWLDLYSDHEEAASTPTPRTAAGINRSSGLRGSRPSSFGTQHKRQDSAQTVRQGDIDRSPDSSKLQQARKMLASDISNPRSDQLSPIKSFPEKSPPQNHAIDIGNSSHADQVDVSPRSKRGTSIASGLPSQQSKRRVVWKGKACTIALPLEDERGTRPLLTPADVVKSVEQWQGRGWDTRGFQLGNSVTTQEFALQSCSPYPDLVDLLEERAKRQFRVGVPNQAEWDTYVSHLKEEKLRALGVTLNDSDGQQSIQSPTPSSRSQTSSRLPQSFSPPLLTPSSTSNLLLSNSRPLSPTFYASSSSSRVGSVSTFSPHLGPSQHGMHLPGIFTGYPVIKPRMTSPFNPNELRQTSPLQRQVLPPASVVQPLQRWPPPGGGALQILAQVISPVSPLLEESSGVRANALPGQQRKSQELHPTPAHQQHQQTHTQSSPFTSFGSRSLHPGDERGIIHPAPQPHQRNISVALQKEVDAAVEERQSTTKPFPMQATRNPHDERSKATIPENSHRAQSRRDDRAHQDGHKSGLRSDSLAHPHLATNMNQNTASNLSSISDPMTSDSSGSKQGLFLRKAGGALGHRAKSSVSSLNVEAEEFRFNPRNQFLSSNFIFNEDALQSTLDVAGPVPGNTTLPKSVIAKPKTATGLNVDAPTFTPSTFQKSDFKFNPATFNVDAPAFNPRNSVNQVESAKEVDRDIAPAADKIFTKIAIDATTKATRRGKSSKMLPVAQPDKHEDTEDDEDGRVRVSTTRQKRARMQGNGGGEESPRYATPVRQQGADLPSSGGERASPSSKTEPSQIEKNEASRPTCTQELDAATTSVTGENRGGMGGRSTGETQLPETKSSFSSLANPVLARGDGGTINNLSPTKDHAAQDIMVEDSSELDHLSGDRSRASLSPLLVSNSARDKSFSSSSSTSKARKSLGLEASRYAATPPSSPPISNVHPTTLTEHLPVGTSEAFTSPRQFVKNVQDCETAAPEQTADDSKTMEKVTETSTDTILPANPSSSISSLGSPGAGLEVETVHLHDGIDADGSIDGATYFDATTNGVEEVEDVAKHEATSSKDVSSAASIGGRQDEAGPSYDEIDAVMKQFEDNPDLGVERAETPPNQSGPAKGLFLNPSINIRSDAPSPSPGRGQGGLEPRQDAKATIDIGHQPFVGTVIHLGEPSMDQSRSPEVSDWNDALSHADEGKFETRTRFFDTHVNALVGGLLEDRLGPLERTLSTIHHSVALLAARSQVTRPRTGMSTGMSDADDEDEDAELSQTTPYRTRSPFNQKKERPGDAIKTAVLEALAAHQLESSSRASENVTVEQVLNEVKSLKEASTSREGPDELKAIVEDVISTHPRLRGKRVQEDHQAGASQKFQIQLDGLESMLKVANERAEEEYQARRRVEDDLAETTRQLKLMAEEAAQYREASEEAELGLRNYFEEKESMEGLEQTNSGLALKNAALETTLEEYRLSHDQWRVDIDDERKRNRELKAVLQSLRREIEETSQIKKGLRARFERLQDDMVDVVERVAHDQNSWTRQEYEFSAKAKEMEAEIQRETRIRQKLELELNQLDQEHREVLKFRNAYELSQKECNRLEGLVVQLQQASRTHEDAAHGFEREIHSLHASAKVEVSRTQSIYEHDINLLRSEHDLVRAELEAQIVRLEADLQQSREGADELKAKHQGSIDEHLHRHGRALHDLSDSKEAALTEQRRSHEKALNDLRERHARALHNASDDKHRLEAHTKEKLALSNDKIQNLEDKVTNLQERLTITSSAARAAAEAATSRAAPKADLPSPLSSPSSTTASIPLVRGSNVPDKISPQALRESIMVLQDQLQHREQTIECLEDELTNVDKDAPSKIRDRDTEIAWLRELLGVRIDDLREIIHALSETEFNREAIKDAVIRLKANLQMEQQERERAATTGGTISPAVLPSISSQLSSLTQSPRALPMAAAAAWGNWRKARDQSADTTNTDTVGSQTPSRGSGSASPQSFLSGLLTPPSTSQRPASPVRSAPPAMMALGGRKTSAEARPLRGYGGQGQSSSSRQAEKRPLRQSTQQQQQQQQQRRQEVPRTPPRVRGGGDEDGNGEVDARTSILSDVDDDASLIGSGSGDGSGLDGVVGPLLGEPFEESAAQ